MDALDPSTAPFISIVVPTYGRPAQLADCLRALCDLDYPRDRFDVIVVDDGSELPPRSVTASYQGRLDVRLLSIPHGGPAAARNHGASHAKGEFLAFTDDDCAPDRFWLKALAARFAGSPDRAVGGRTRNALVDNVFATAGQILVDYLYSYYNQDPADASFFASNNLAFPAATFRALKGFTTSFPLASGEDRDLCDRWRQHGHGMTYAPEVLVDHSHRLTFRTYCRQHFNYGRGAFQFRQLRARREGGPVKVEPPSFYLRLVGFPFSCGQGWKAVRLAALLLLAQAAVAAGFLWEKSRGRSRSPRASTPLES